MSLEELHWRLSVHPAMCAGFRNRGTLVEGAWADIVVYDLNKLAMKPMEIVRVYAHGKSDCHMMCAEQRIVREG